MNSTHSRWIQKSGVMFTLAAIVLLAALPAGAQTLTTVYSFLGSPNDGSRPFGGVIRDAAGNFYGTTQHGGNTGFTCSSTGCGTVFMLTKNGTSYTESVLFKFNHTTSGQNPAASLVMDAAGNLYGTTPTGGSLIQGVVFKLTKSGNSYTESVLHPFGGSDGMLPEAPLIFDAAGNLYGTTSGGGSGVGCGINGCGTVFMLNPTTQVLTTLHNFAGGTDGYQPSYGSLVMDADGNLYGTTFYGGSIAACSGSGCGTVYKLTKNGDSYTQSVLYTFTGGTDGAYPYAGVTMDAGGNLYGTAGRGGNSNNGVVYMLTKNGDSYTQSVLHSFAGGSDGAGPMAGVTMDALGNLYGTTNQGDSGTGTVFMLTKNGSSYTESILHGFTGGSDGRLPGPGNLLLDGGNVYGTTMFGGDVTAQGGTVWQYSLPGITAPAKGSTLTGSTVNFAWNPMSGAVSYQLWLGSSPNTFDVGYIGTSDLSGALAGVPTDGRALYATLWAWNGSSWTVEDTATYTAASLAAAQITSPAKGSTLSGSVMPFTWTAETGATSYQLWAGTTPGGYDITYGGTSDTAVSLTLPTDGSTVYVTLWGYSGGNWTVQDTATYTAASTQQSK